VHVKILIVDDHARIRRLIRQVLVETAHEVVECADGDAALHLWTDARPDLVLMDLEMPGTDGLAATRAIRHSVPSAVVVILSAHDSPALRLAAQEAGAAGYLLKSDLSRLNELVDGVKAELEVRTNLNP